MKLKNDLQKKLKADYDSVKNKDDFLHALKEYLHKELSGRVEQPVDWVRWVDIDKVKPNDYNPNSVAHVELKLLYTSIKHDGYTQPVVTIYDAENDVYIIVDGFHRYFTMRNNPDIMKLNRGQLPIVVINSDINDRMASTVRHNRARGKHSVTGMSSMVFNMLENGWEDVQICNELGMEPEELLKLKHVTGFSKLFENTEYAKAWEAKNQINIREQYNKTGSGKIPRAGKINVVTEKNKAKEKQKSKKKITFKIGGKKK